MSHPAISLHQPWCQWLVTRQPCDCPAMPPPFGGPIHRDACASLAMVKGWETRSWPCPPALIGQPIAIHATKRKPNPGWQGEVGGWRVKSANDHGDFEMYLRGQADVPLVPLPLGAVVGSGRITASLEILTFDQSYEMGCTEDSDYIVDTAGHYDSPTLGSLRRLRSHVDDTGFTTEVTDLEDQRSLGDFTPGRYAWQIEDAAPCTERCPWCDGTGADPVDVVAKGCDRMECDQYCRHPNCPVCDGAGRCDPAPAKGRQRIWNWQP